MALDELGTKASSPPTTSAHFIAQEYHGRLAEARKRPPRRPRQSAAAAYTAPTVSPNTA